MRAGVEVRYQHRAAVSSSSPQMGICRKREPQSPVGTICWADWIKGMSRWPSSTSLRPMPAATAAGWRYQAGSTMINVTSIWLWWKVRAYFLLSYMKSLITAKRKGYTKYTPSIKNSPNWPTLMSKDVKMDTFFMRVCCGKGWNKTKKRNFHLDAFQRHIRPCPQPRPRPARWFQRAYQSAQGQVFGPSHVFETFHPWGHTANASWPNVVHFLVLQSSWPTQTRRWLPLWDLSRPRCVPWLNFNFHINVLHGSYVNVHINKMSIKYFYL